MLRFLERYGLISAFVIIFLISSVFIDSFFTFSNVLNIFSQSLVVLILGFGLTIILISGEIDLSFAGWVPLASTLFARLLATSISPYLAIVIVLIAGALLGSLISFMVVKLRLASFISTIGLMYLTLGINHAITGGRTQWITGSLNRDIFFGTLGPFPKSVLILLVLFSGLYILINHTRFGLKLKATGEHKENSIALGINTKVVKTISFVMGSVLFSFAAILQTVRVSGAMEQSGMTLMLSVMAIAFIGQVAFGIGKATIKGALLAALLLALIENAFTLIQAPFWYFPLIESVVLILAVVVNNLRTREIIQIEF